MATRCGVAPLLALVSTFFLILTRCLFISIHCRPMLSGSSPLSDDDFFSTATTAKPRDIQNGAIFSPIGVVCKAVLWYAVCLCVWGIQLGYNSPHRLTTTYPKAGNGDAVLRGTMATAARTAVGLTQVTQHTLVPVAVVEDVRVGAKSAFTVPLAHGLGLGGIGLQHVHSTASGTRHTPLVHGAEGRVTV